MEGLEYYAHRFLYIHPFINFIGFLKATLMRVCRKYQCNKRRNHLKDSSVSVLLSVFSKIKCFIVMYTRIRGTITECDMVTIVTLVTM